MNNDKNSLKLDALCGEIRGPVRAFAEKLTAALGTNLQGITVIGSSLTEDFVPRKSDINTVLVLGKLDLASLNALAEMAKSVSKKRLSAPLLMTLEYIERSRDVFGIEFLDFQLTHETVFGSDPFASLGFSKADVRLQCERELKATLIRLRQGYIASAANKKLIRDVLIATAGAMVPLLRAMLWLKEAGRPNTAEAVFAKAAVEFSVKMDSLAAAARWRHKKTSLHGPEIKALFASVYKTVEQLAFIVDKLKV
jgi:hypothetical protein